MYLRPVRGWKRPGNESRSGWKARPARVPPKKKPTRTGPGGRLGAGFLNPGRRRDRLGSRQLSLRDERVLAKRQLLVVQGQLAAGRRDQLGVDCAVDRVGQEANSTVAECEVGAGGVAAGHEGEAPLDRQDLAIVDVLVGPKLVGLLPLGID